VQRAFDQGDGPRGRGQPPALGPVGGEDGVDRVRRDRLAEFGTRRPVPVAGTLDAGLRMVPRHRGERRGVPSQHSVQPEIRRHDVKQPGDSGRLEVLAVRRMHSGWPARRYVRSHIRSITRARTTIRLMSY